MADDVDVGSCLRLSDQFSMLQDESDQLIGAIEPLYIKGIDIANRSHADVYEMVLVVEPYDRKHLGFLRIALAFTRGFDPVFYIFSHVRWEKQVKGSSSRSART